MKKILFAIPVAILLAIAIYFAVYGIQTAKYKELMKTVVVNEINLSDISDGTYSGSFNAYLVAADVIVTVANHHITDIKLMRHKNERGQSGEAVIAHVLNAQTLSVDVVSGATNSSKVILKAIEEALN